MTGRRNRKAELVAEQVLGWGAELITQAVESAKAELDRHDGYPTKTPGASLPAASGPGRLCGACKGRGCDQCAPSQYTATERAAERRYELSNKREELRDALDAWVQQWEWIVRQAREIAGTRLERIEGTRCSGVIDPTCTNNASPHRMPDGSPDESTCDACFLASCPTCRLRAAESKRGNQCEACYRRTLRAGRAA